MSKDANFIHSPAFETCVVKMLEERFQKIQFEEQAVLKSLEQEVAVA